MMENPEISTPQLSEKIGISETAIENNIRFLRENGYIERQGTFGGKWIVNS